MRALALAALWGTALWWSTSVVHAGPQAVVHSPPGADGTVAEQADRAWAVATSRALGAAGSVRDRAWRLREAAQATLATGRVGGVSALVADATELDRTVVSAVLAAQVMAQAAPPDPAPAAP